MRLTLASLASAWIAAAGVATQFGIPSGWSGWVVAAVVCSFVIGGYLGYELLRLGLSILNSMQILSLQRVIRWVIDISLGAELTTAGLLIKSMVASWLAPTPA